MSYLCYQLKIESAFNRNIYRIMEISGDRTFAELSDCILDAFEFDKDHLYMFSLNRKAYDPNGIYHPMGKQGKRADRVRLQDVNPVVKNKYLYLYDFGDDWMFYITVMKVNETDLKIPAKITFRQGELCQYPNWDEDWENEEDWDGKEDSYDEGDFDEDGFAAADDLVITPVYEDDAVVKERLMSIPAILQNMWIRLVKEDLPMAGDEEIELLYRLEKAGLVEVDESEMHLYLRVKRGKADYKEYGIWDNLQKRYDLEHVIVALVGIYGVVEQDMLYVLLCQIESVSGCSKELFEDIIKKLNHWKFWNNKIGADGTIYISSFCSEITEVILQRRKKYPVKRYCTLDKEAEDALLAGSWKGACPVYGKTFHYLFWERRWSQEDTEALLEHLVKCVAMGDTEQEYFTWIDGVMKENNMPLTKAMRKVFREFRNELPSAVLKGYTWGEYEKDGRKDGYHQLSLFEEELPF